MTEDVDNEDGAEDDDDDLTDHESDDEGARVTQDQVSRSLGLHILFRVN